MVLGSINLARQRIGGDVLLLVLMLMPLMLLFMTMMIMMMVIVKVIITMNTTMLSLTLCSLRRWADYKHTATLQASLRSCCCD